MILTLIYLMLPDKPRPLVGLLSIVEVGLIDCPAFFLGLRFLGHI